MSGVNAVLDKLFSDGVINLESGREVVVKRVTLRTMKPITTLLTKVLDDLKLDANNLPTVSVSDTATILKLISENYEAIVGIVVSLTDVTMDELLDMSTDESVPIIQAVILLNKHFFTTKVLPSLQHVADDI